VRVVLDTGVFIAALIRPGSSNYRILRYWRGGKFTLLTSEAQINELRRVSKRKHQAGVIERARAGSLVNLLREEAVILSPRSLPDLSPDPDDNLILAIAVEGDADYLASLDLGDVVALQKVGATRILHARDLLELLGG